MQRAQRNHKASRHTSKDRRQGIIIVYTAFLLVIIMAMLAFAIDIGFIRTQLDARSLEPREGDDPDAILSRAEAATQQGRLTDALAEIEALPDVARAELSDWAAQATRRLEAVAAAQQLSEELN